MGTNRHTRYPDWAHRLIGMMGLMLSTIYIFLIPQKLAEILRALFYSQ